MKSRQSITQLNAKHSKSHSHGERQRGKGTTLITLKEFESTITIY